MANKPEIGFKYSIEENCEDLTGEVIEIIGRYTAKVKWSDGQITTEHFSDIPFSKQDEK